MRQLIVATAKMRGAEVISQFLAWCGMSMPEAAGVGDVMGHGIARYPSIPPPSQNKSQIGLNLSLFGAHFRMGVV